MKNAIAKEVYMLITEDNQVMVLEQSYKKKTFKRKVRKYLISQIRDILNFNNLDKQAMDSFKSDIRQLEENQLSFKELKKFVSYFGYEIVLTKSVNTIKIAKLGTVIYELENNGLEVYHIGNSNTLEIVKDDVQIEIEVYAKFEDNLCTTDLEIYMLNELVFYINDKEIECDELNELYILIVNEVKKLNGK